MANEDPGPIVQRLLLGDELRKLREAAGMTAEEANLEVPKWYRGKLGKVENGALRITEEELDRLLKVYRAAGEDADRVRKLGAESRRKTTPARVPDWAKQFVRLEQSATEIRLCFGDVLPGMLQTRDYAQAQLSVSLSLPPADIAASADEREQRGNRVFSDDPPRVWALLGEESLLRPVGGQEVMRGQLQRLDEMAQLPHVSLRVIPLSAGVHPALGCPFTMLYLEHARASIAYVESLTNGDYIKNPATYTLAFEHVGRVALSETQSMKMLGRLIANLE
jgi:hypothetical protein